MIVAPLTGLEGRQRAHRTVALDTHVRDVVALLNRDDLSRAILVGHSYAGMIITGVAEHVRDRIAIWRTSTRWSRNTVNRPWTSCPTTEDRTVRMARRGKAGEYAEWTSSTCGVSRRVPRSRFVQADCATSPYDASRSLWKRRRTRLTSFLVRISRA